MKFTWLEAGSTSVTWSGPRRLVVARGSASRAAAGASTIRVKLTAAGRKQLKRRPNAKLTVTTTFTRATTGAKVTAARTFKPRRR